MNTDCLTVTGKTLGENIAEYDVRSDSVSEKAISLYVEGCKATGKSVVQVRQEIFDAHGQAPKLESSIQGNPCIEKSEDFDPFDVIREMDRRYSDEGGLTILYGNLAEEGSVVKTAGVDPEMMTHEGPAIVFESQEDACKGILGKQVKEGMVVVIRNEGPRGGPGNAGNAFTDQLYQRNGTGQISGIDY